MVSSQGRVIFSVWVEAVNCKLLYWNNIYYSWSILGGDEMQRLFSPLGNHLYILLEIILGSVLRAMWKSLVLIYSFELLDTAVCNAWLTCMS